MGKSLGHLNTVDSCLGRTRGCGIAGGCASLEANYVVSKTCTISSVLSVFLFRSLSPSVFPPPPCMYVFMRYSSVLTILIHCSS